MQKMLFYINLELGKYLNLNIQFSFYEQTVISYQTVYVGNNIHENKAL
jgi:hypothetical protein